LTHSYVTVKLAELGAVLWPTAHLTVLHDAPETNINIFVCCEGLLLRKERAFEL
jgi:hypothetical protein